jgi:hypothetical protein
MVSWNENNGIDVTHETATRNINTESVKYRSFYETMGAGSLWKVKRVTSD